MNALDFEHKTDNKVALLEKEIAELKRRIEYLEHSIPYFGKAISYTTRSGVSGDIVWKENK